MGNRNAKKALAAAACAVVAVLAVGGAVMAALFFSPKSRLFRGFRSLAREAEELQNPLLEKAGMEQIVETLSEEGGYTKSRLNVSSDILKELIGTTLTVGVDTESNFDREEKRLDADTAFSVMNYELAGIQLSVDENHICFSVPELFLEDMYIDTQNVVSQYNSSVWAGENRFGKLEMEDFSVNLFEQRTWTIEDMMQSEQCMRDLKAVRETMTVDKVEKGLYRIRLTQPELETLIQDMLKEQESVALAETGLDRYGQIFCSDVSLLVGLGKKSRIEGIRLEEPVLLLDSAFPVQAEIFFAGEERSLDQVQGKVTIEPEDGEALEVTARYIPTVGRTGSRTEINVKCSVGEKTGRLNYMAEFDAVSDDFSLEFSARMEEDNIQIEADGGFRDILQGESFDLELERLSVGMDGRELYDITGDIAVAPPQDEAIVSVKPGTAFFEMTDAEWAEVFAKAVGKYGSLFDLFG